MAEVQGLGFLSKGRTTMFPGTAAEMEVETAVQHVRPMGSAAYIASAINNVGQDEGLQMRAKAMGNPPIVPFWKRAHAATVRQAKALAKKLESGDRIDPNAPAVAVPVAHGAPLTPEQELSTQIAAFRGEPEMQRAIFERWSAKHAAPVAKVAETFAELPPVEPVAKKAGK